MKAVSFASIISIALAGAACSDTPTKTDEPVIETPAATETAGPPADDGFNFMIPGDEIADPVVNDGFNLSIPDTGSTIASGEFNLPADIPNSRDLSGLPDIKAPLLEDTVETEDTPDEDAIIRIE